MILLFLGVFLGTK